MLEHKMVLIEISLPYPSVRFWVIDVIIIFIRRGYYQDLGDVEVFYIISKNVCFQKYRHVCGMLALYKVK